MSIEIIALVVSLFATLFSIIAIFQSHRYRKTALEQRLFDQRNTINMAFAEFGVRGPFATLLKIPEAELGSYIPKVCLLNMQINLLNDVFQNKRAFDKDIRSAHESWAKTILKPWVADDPNLLLTMDLIYNSKDIFQTDFVRWLKILLKD